MNAKTSNFTVTAVAVSALALGLLAGSFAVRAKLFSAPMKGVIAITKDTTKPDVYDCTQTVNGDQDAYPHLARPFGGIGGNTIAWTGINLAGAATNNVDVVFPPRDGSPFSKADFHRGEDSGTIVAGARAKDYPFASVTVDGTPCSQYIDPGVHANQ